jgi:DNA-binding FrmR family transcriptional regulator
MVSKIYEQQQPVAIKTQCVMEAIRRAVDGARCSLYHRNLRHCVYRINRKIA